MAARKKALLDQGLDLSREDAFWLVDDLENLEGEQLTGALDRLERYEMQNPGEIDRYVAGKATAQFEQEYIDSTPHPSSRLSRAQKDAINARARISIDNPEAAKFIPFPESYDDLPTAQPGSHHAVVKMLEDQGVDTTSGLGNFGQVLNIARKLNGSNRQFMAMATLVYDMLDNAGIEVPDGYPVIRTQEDLGQMMFLLPIEEGKAKWTLVEPEEMRWADLGAVGDLEEIMATVGAVLSQITPAGKGATRVGRFFSRHPAIAEFVSEFSLRRFGTLLEYWLDSDATAEDLEQALEGEYFETGLNVAIGRSIGRMIDTARGIKSPRGIYVSRTQLGAESVEEAERMTAEIIEETADTVEALQKLTDRDFAVTRGAASDSLPELQIQDARKKRAKPRERDYLERVDHYNLQALQDANNNLATRNSTADPTSIDSYQAVNAPHASERAAVEGLGNDIKVNTWGTIEDDIAYMDVRFV
ncbi:MAG: hypothetical protein GTO63_08570, partial [Anaerolineae bacterium]|nr:hypothetical protein [Anaerolineae bacterium]NIN94958.1 hypothetical protein [Anaerolineae bacterium]NIQ78000.1 hypothetical protein [Anaerolineae bacterium]